MILGVWAEHLGCPSCAVWGSPLLALRSLLFESLVWNTTVCSACMCMDSFMHRGQKVIMEARGQEKRPSVTPAFCLWGWISNLKGFCCQNWVILCLGSLWLHLIMSLIECQNTTDRKEPCSDLAYFSVVCPSCCGAAADTGSTRATYLQTLLPSISPYVRSSHFKSLLHSLESTCGSSITFTFWFALFSVASFLLWVLFSHKWEELHGVYEVCAVTCGDSLALLSSPVPLQPPPAALSGVVPALCMWLHLNWSVTADVSARKALRKCWIRSWCCLPHLSPVLL